MFLSPWRLLCHCYIDLSSLRCKFNISFFQLQRQHLNKPRKRAKQLNNNKYSNNRLMIHHLHKNKNLPLLLRNNLPAIVNHGGMFHKAYFSLRFFTVSLVLSCQRTAKCSTKLSKRLRSRKVEAGKVVVRHTMFLSFAFDVLFILLLITNEDYL